MNKTTITAPLPSYYSERSTNEARNHPIAAAEFADAIILNTTDLGDGLFIHWALRGAQLVTINQAPTAVVDAMMETGVSA